jgi:hypothetical protein
MKRDGAPKSAEADFTAANTDKTVYTVSTGRTFRLTDIIVANKEGSAVTVTIWDGASATGTKMLVVQVPATDTKAITDIRNGPEFATSVVAQVSSYTNGSSITIGGYEQ